MSGYALRIAFIAIFFLKFAFKPQWLFTGHISWVCAGHVCCPPVGQAWVMREI